MGEPAIEGRSPSPFDVRVYGLVERAESDARARRVVIAVVNVFFREDRVFGVTGHWTERGPRRAVKCETACPFARTASAAPEICTDVIHALEEATFRELHPGYRLLPLERLLSKGHTACEFVHVLRDDGAP